MTVRLQCLRRWHGLVIRALAFLLIAAGGAAVSFAVWVHGEARSYQRTQSAQFDDPVHPPEKPQPPMLPPALPFARPDTRRPWRDPAALARLEIPRLDLRVVIREGVDEATLRRAVGHVPGTALPGEPGNFVVAGHRDTFFRPLRYIASGDRLVVRTARKAFEYEVTSVVVVEPEYGEVLREGSEAVCTLVTCFPFDYAGPAPRRWIVRARLNVSD